MISASTSRVSRYNEDGTHPDLPVGFRFHPTPQDVVQQFLDKKASGKEMPESPIKEVDVYRFDPEQLPITITNGRARWMYFFVFMSEDNMDRSTPNGFWKIDGQSVRIRDELTNEVVGFKNSFVYYTNELGPNKRYKTNWVMDEYRTNGLDSENSNHPLTNNWMLCKIESPIPQQIVARMVTKKKKGRRARGDDKNGGVNLSVDGTGEKACNA